MGHSVALHVNCLLYQSTMDTDLVICCRWKFIPGLFQDDHSPFGAPPTAPFWCSPPALSHCHSSPLSLRHSPFGILPVAFSLCRQAPTAKWDKEAAEEKEEDRRRRGEKGLSFCVVFLCLRLNDNLFSDKTFSIIYDIYTRIKSSEEKEKKKEYEDDKED